MAPAGRPAGAICFVALAVNRPATGSAHARQVIVLFRSRGASKPVKYSRKPRR
jgi:hypothetical protein